MGCGEIAERLRGNLAQRIDQIRHLRRCGLDFLVDLALVEVEFVGFVQKFGVGDDRREIVPQIVRKGTGGTAERGDAFVLDQLLLRCGSSLRIFAKAVLSSAISMVPSGTIE